MSQIDVSGPGGRAATGPSRFAAAPDRPVFVGACPRSGTTLLRAMLNSHPELALPHETRIVVDTWKRREEFGDPSVERNRRRIARWLVRRKVTRAHRLEVDIEDLVTRMAQAPPTLGSVLGTPYLMYAQHQGKPRWGDKRPHYAQYLDAIFTMFPDAQFINVVRDPRAAVASIRKIGWYQGNVGLATELWERSVRAVDGWRKRLAPDQLLEIRYEDLVADPAATLEPICSFLGLDGSGTEAMLAYHENVDTARNTFFWRVAQPVTVDANRSWEKSLEREEVAFIERATSALMRRYDYQPVAGGVTVPKDLQRAFRERRRQKVKERWQRGWHDNRLRVVYRHPVAARLTSAQRGIDGGDEHP